ncbi:MAG: ATP-binding protein [Ardenticatenaceae bacterium]
MKRSLPNWPLFQSLLPITVVLLVLFGWYMVYIQIQSIEQTSIAAYQQTELELVRSMARSIDSYISEQVGIHKRTDISNIEQEVLRKFIAPVRLLENGDAWIHTPDYVVFDKSADFPDEYRNKNIAQVFEIQKEYGATHYEKLTEGVLQAKEGVDWYIWLAEKGQEIAAWTPVVVNEYVWVVGISTPLSEIMVATGANAQISLLVSAMSVTSILVLGLLLIWGISLLNNRKVENALRASEQKRRLHIEQNPMAVIECDHEGKISAWNGAAEQIFAYTCEEVMGQVAADLLMPKEAPQTTSQMWQSLYAHDEHATRTTNQNRTKDGREIICDWYNTHLLDAEGKTIGVTLMAADVTERIEREQEIRVAKEEAEQATRAKSEFLSNMSHELRTPLNGILGYAQVLKRKPSLDQTVVEGLDIVHQSGQHLLTLINDILDLSKIEARKMELYPTEIDLDDFLAGLAGIIRMRAEDKDVLFRFESDERLPVGVQADETRLRQVLINLLSNAIKFTDNGQVTLRVRQVEDRSNGRKPLARLRFEVIDTGVGMSEQELQKIFLPFEQVGDTKRRAKGTGLGLAITRQLVALMGGEIKVKSEVGKGSTFWFDLSLPVVSVEAKEELGTFDIVGYEGEVQKVLVVDDNLINRLVLSDMLKPLGFEVYEAENGQQAIEQTWEIMPDLILMDLVMPIMSGSEAVKKIRQESAHKDQNQDQDQDQDQDIVIIAVSANLFAEEESQLAGCNGFVSKPVDADQLLAELEKHLQLTWLYKKQNSPDQSHHNHNGSNIPLVPPAQKELKKIYDFAQVWDLAEIEEWANHLQQDPTLAPFAQRLQQLASDFQGEEIMTLVESYL